MPYSRPVLSTTVFALAALVTVATEVDAVGTVVGVAVLAVKVAGKVIFADRAHAVALSPSGQQYPSTRQKLSGTHAPGKVVSRGGYILQLRRTTDKHPMSLGNSIFVQPLGCSRRM